MNAQPKFPVMRGLVLVSFVALAALNCEAIEMSLAAPPMQGGRENGFSLFVFGPGWTPFESLFVPVTVLGGVQNVVPPVVPGNSTEAGLAVADSASEATLDLWASETLSGGTESLVSGWLGLVLGERVAYSIAAFGVVSAGPQVVDRFMVHAGFSGFSVYEEGIAPLDPVPIGGSATGILEPGYYGISFACYLIDHAYDTSGNLVPGSAGSTDSRLTWEMSLRLTSLPSSVPDASRTAVLLGLGLVGLVGLRRRLS